MFLLAGEILRQRSHLESVEVGSLMGLFGVGLLCGNGLVARIERIKTSNNTKLIVIILIIMAAIMLFLSGWLSLIGHGLCLTILGGMLGLASPISTSMLARQSAENKGFVLSISESVNNLVLLSALPVFSLFFSKGHLVISMIMIVIFLSSAIFLVFPTRQRKDREQKDSRLLIFLHRKWFFSGEKSAIGQLIVVSFLDAFHLTWIAKLKM